MDGTGIDRARVMEDLRRRRSMDVPFSSGRILGSMCTAPHPVALEAHMLFHESNLGNPGLCPGTAEMEKEVISMLSSLYNGPTAYGKVLSGGTEANITAMYMAKKRTGRRKVIFGSSAHFSVLKAVRLLDLEPVRIGLGPDYRMDLSQLEEAMDEDVMMVHAVAGTTELGVVDDVSGIADIAEGVPLHVDGAFGGFVLPFLDTEHLEGMGVGDWDFRVDGVETMAVDPHKMGLSTIPSGCLLYRDQKALDYLKVDSPYLTSPSSFTLAGTRGSGAVAATWAVMRHLGREGYTRVVRTCMDNTYYLMRRLSELDLSPVIRPTMNVLAVRHDDPTSIERRLRDEGYFISTVRDPPALRFVVMPHVTVRAIDDLMPVLERALRRD
jgi:tyrosine decarboxylase/aspartate 1-decarboxylase